LTVDVEDDTHQLMDMLLARKRASDRRNWLEASGDMAEI
jgi:topoisomerase-4 subunit B